MPPTSSATAARRGLPPRAAGFHTGMALRWNERGFGFIKLINPDQGNDEVFCHASAIVGGNALKAGCPCMFKLEYDDRRGKHRASEVFGEAVTSDGARHMACDRVFCRCGERPGDCASNAQRFQLQTKPLGDGRSGEVFIGLDIQLNETFALRTGAYIWHDSSGETWCHHANANTVTSLLAQISKNHFCLFSSTA
jgi:cold shock CspA family protein